MILACYNGMLQMLLYQYSLSKHRLYFTKLNCISAPERWYLAAFFFSSVERYSISLFLFCCPSRILDLNRNKTKPKVLVFWSNNVSQKSFSPSWITKWLLLNMKQKRPFSVKLWKWDCLTLFKHNPQL